MFQYIVKRLALMVVTLLGITVITFLITRLAPGDPAALKVQGAIQAAGGGKGQQLSEAIIEDNRRILGLDRPIVLNFEPKGRRAEVRRILADLGSNEEYIYKRAQKHLTPLKSAALATVFARLDEPTTPGLRRRLLDLLPRLVTDPLPPQLQSLSPDEQEEWWTRWWEENQGKYTEANGKEVVEAYFANPTAENFQRVVSVAAFAVPYLIERVDSDDPAIVDLATRPLAVIVGRSWSTHGEEDAKERRRLVYRWQNWWQYQKPKFVEFNAFQRFLRVFTNTQYGIWLGKVLTFDFDVSYAHYRPVLDLIKERLPISLQLSLISIFLSYLISIPLGIFSATHQFKLSDKVVTTGLFILYSLPSFWVADMLILFVTEREAGYFFQVFPVQYMSAPEGASFWAALKHKAWHFFLPVACLTYTSLAFLSRQMRVAMLEAIRQDFIRTAQAKGLSRQMVIFKHALRNSLIPILTLAGFLLPELIGGSIIIESIFGIPGMGKLTIESIMLRDYPVINAVAFFAAFLTLVGVLLSDLSYALVDPRIRYE